MKLIKRDDPHENGEYALVRAAAPHWRRVVDVGANVGNWTAEVLRVNPSCQAICYEPGRLAFERLNARFGGWHQVRLHNLAVGDTDAGAIFYDYGGNESEMNTLHKRSTWGTVRETYPVNVVPLRETGVDFVKVDAEGHDAAVLRGMRQLLEAGTVVQFEYGGGWRDAREDLRDIADYLGLLGYWLFRIRSEGLELVREIHNSYCYNNFVAARSEEQLQSWGIKILGEPAALEEKKMSTDEPLVLVFSKDRAFQLEGCVRSFMEHGEGKGWVHVLWKASSDAHAEAYCGPIRVITIPVREHLFAAQVIAALKRSRYVFFICDDTIITGPLHLSEAVDLLEKEPLAFGVSFRLGKNTKYCYMRDSDQRVPAFTETNGPFLLWPWARADLDFAYPAELSASLYRTEDILRLLGDSVPGSPNELEALLDKNRGTLQSVRPLLACLSGGSVAFSAAVNSVKVGFAANRVGKLPDHSPEALLRRFQAGERMDIERWRGFVSNSAHMEVNLLDSEPEFEPAAPKETDKAVILAPVSDRAHPFTEDLIQRLVYLHGIERIRVLGGRGVCKVRSQLASLAMERDETWQIWIDDDTIATPAEVLRLLETAKAYNLDALAAVVPVRRGPARPNFFPIHPEEPFRLGKGGGVIEVQGLGLACAVVHRRVFERMQSKAPPAIYQDPTLRREIEGYAYFLDEVSDQEIAGRVRHQHFTEDFAWCRLARATGSKLWVATDIVAGHASETILGIDDIVSGMREIQSGPPPKGLVVLVPFYQRIEPEVEDVIAELRARGVRVETSGDQAGIDRVRCAMVNRELADDSVEWIGWLDADQVCRPDVFDMLIKSAEDAKADMMCAVYVDRQTCKHINFRPDREAWNKLDPDHAGKPISFGAVGQRIPVEFVAQGCSVTHRRAFEKLAPFCKEADYICGDLEVEGRAYYLPDVVDRRHVGEDYAFAHLCKRAGVVSMVDTRICVGHVGRKVYEIGDLIRSIEESENAARKRKQQESNQPEHLDGNQGGPPAKASDCYSDGNGAACQG